MNDCLWLAMGVCKDKCRCTRYLSMNSNEGQKIGMAWEKKYVEGFAGEVKRMKCKVCGVEFKPKKEDKYIVKVKKRTSVVTADIEIYDAFDCPECGCQQLAGLRHVEMTEPTCKTVTFDLKENDNE